MSTPGFPFTPFPRSWYNVLPSTRVTAGEVVPLEILGKQLVCFRSESGTIVVSDAFCPHLGAHIGFGGRVVGEEIVCPFHEWRFDTAGRNVSIPYSDRPNRSARLGVMASEERAGMIFVWHDPDGGPPMWDLPDLHELRSQEHVLLCPEDAVWRFRSHPQEVLENVVDIAHFKSVHGVGSFGGVTAETDGPMFRASAEVEFVTPKGPTKGSVVSELWGLGIDVVRHQGLGPPACGVLTVTPVDGEQVEARYLFLLPRDPEGDGPSRYGLGLTKDFIKQIQQDIPIWEHKCYRDRPGLAAGEADLMRYRRWAGQFYPDTVPAVDLEKGQ